MAKIHLGILLPNQCESDTNLYSDFIKESSQALTGDELEFGYLELHHFKDLILQPVSITLEPSIIDKLQEIFSSLYQSNLFINLAEITPKEDISDYNVSLNLLINDKVTPGLVSWLYGIQATSPYISLGTLSESLYGGLIIPVTITSLKQAEKFSILFRKEFGYPLPIIYTDK